MRQRNLRLCCLVVLCVALFAVNSTAKPIDFSEFDRVAPEELKATNTPGAVIVVVSGNQVVYQKAFGGWMVESVAADQPPNSLGWSISRLVHAVLRSDFNRCLRRVAPVEFSPAFQCRDRADEVIGLVA